MHGPYNGLQLIQCVPNNTWLDVHVAATTQLLPEIIYPLSQAVHPEAVQDVQCAGQLIQVEDPAGAYCAAPQAVQLLDRAGEY